MTGLTLFIGSKHLSSWSLRPWLLLRHHGLEFKEVVIPLDRPDTRARILEHSPTGRVPALLHGRTTVWESLAICEYAAEAFALPGAWPMEPDARAFARSVAHEMHCGYADLRRELPFDAGREPAPKAISDAARADIERICTIWRQARSRFGWRGQWLLGHFGIVDAMFAPVAMRFAAYGVELGRTEREYVDTVLAHPAIAQWTDDAAMEVSSPARPPADAAREARPAPQATAPAPRPPAEATPVAVVAAPVKAAEAPKPAAATAQASGGASAAAHPVVAESEAKAAAPVLAVADDIGEDEMPPASPGRTAATTRSRKETPSDKPASTRVRSTMLPPD